jgi:hypothetical protein
MMAIDLDNYRELCSTFSKIDLFHEDPGLLPRVTTQSEIADLISNGAAFMPRLYRLDYAQRLHDNLAAAMIRGKVDPREIRLYLEPFCAPLYQHHPGAIKTQVRKELHRFLAVISNLYRSFTSERKRRSIDVPIVTEIPPLAFFESNGESGPYTITSETMQSQLGTSTSIVSLPQSYRAHPIAWSSLTHEVCGHDIVHADEQLVPELVAGIRALFCPQGFDRDSGLAGDDLNALIWSYWIDEAVADVYGILNMGPTFPLNLSAFLYAFIAVHQGSTQPVGTLRTSTVAGRDGRMDGHPTDILRLHLAIGAIDSLTGLSVKTKRQYIEDIENVARLAANGATFLELKGAVQISHDHWRDIAVRIPLAEAQDGARRAGAFMATARLRALGDHSVQDIESWDDMDEQTATEVAGRIFQRKSLIGAGDDAQLLAGATRAVLDQRGIYDTATALLNDALDDSYLTDPIWQGLSFDLMVDFDCLAGRKKQPFIPPGRKLKAPAKKRRGKK